MKPDNNTFKALTDVSGSSERRLSLDRRAKPTPLISKHTFKTGRRKHLRRTADRRTYAAVDIYSPRLFIMIVALLILTLLDSYFTLILVEAPFVTEANPIMAFYLDLGHIPFILVKFFITVAGIVIVCLCPGVFLRRIILFAPASIYAVVVAYELVLLFRISSQFN